MQKTEVNFMTLLNTHRMQLDALINRDCKPTQPSLPPSLRRGIAREQLDIVDSHTHNRHKHLRTHTRIQTEYKRLQH